MKREATSVETTAPPAKKTKTGKSYRCTVCSQLFHELEIGTRLLYLLIY